MSKFLLSLEAEPAEQRMSRAAIYLRALVFGRLSDDHVLALALLNELGGIYDRAYGTDQVLKGASSLHVTQERALEAHLRALGLPCYPPELHAGEVETLLETWGDRAPTLPRPFNTLIQAFLERAKAQLSAPPSYPEAVNLNPS